MPAAQCLFRLERRKCQLIDAQPVEIIEPKMLQKVTFKPLKSLGDAKVERKAQNVGMSNI